MKASLKLISDQYKTATRTNENFTSSLLLGRSDFLNYLLLHENMHGDKISQKITDGFVTLTQLLN